jgi:hypothetical protein
MKTPLNRDELLDDLLEEAVSPGLQATLLERTLRAVRWKKRRQLTQRGLLVLVIVAVIGVALWQRTPQVLPPPQRPQPDLVPASTPFLSTQPLVAGEVPQTRPGAVVVISSVKGVVPVLQTMAAETGVKVLDDQGLLKLLASKPVVLVQFASHQPELVFLNPADAKGFPLR